MKVFRATSVASESLPSLGFPRFYEFSSAHGFCLLLDIKIMEFQILIFGLHNLKNS